MLDALTLFFEIYKGLLSFVFNDMTIVSGVSVGWVAISCLVFGILIRSLLAVPRAAQTHTFREKNNNE